jgi:P27 family predicted phage terminase small subunit
MGLRGPAPTPTAILKNRGSWLANLRKGEPEFPVSEPPKPEWLNVQAGEEWDRQIVLLRNRGVIAEVDLATFAGYCMSWSEWVMAEEWIANNGYTFETEKGYIGTQPMVAIRNAAFDRMTKAAKEFGFTPSSRTKVKVDGGQPKTKLDKFKLA